MGLAEKVMQAQLKLRQPKKDTKGERSVYLDLPDAIALAFAVFAGEGVAIMFCSEVLSGRLHVGARFEADGEVSRTFWAPVVAKVILPRSTDFSKLSSEAIEAMTTPGPQEYGSAMTYARRYAVCGLTGIVGDKDDDAQSVQDLIHKGKPKPQPETQPETPGIEPWWVTDARIAVRCGWGDETDSSAVKEWVKSFVHQTVRPSGSGGADHKVARAKDGVWRCDCKGYQARKTCSHTIFAELSHRAQVLGDKYQFNAERVAKLDPTELLAELLATEEIRKTVAPTAGGWEWSGRGTK